ncbi:serine threonine-protein kinase nek9 [Stemphylium lycopersici]|nr:serine threonine-protein kinase nek9 [Stemphylium lycopersici]
MMQQVYAFGLLHHEADSHPDGNNNRSSSSCSSCSSNDNNVNVNVNVNVNSIQHTPGLDAEPTLASSRLDPFLSANSIVVLWSSWCDVVLAYTSDGHGHGLRSWQVRYLGTGLSPAQKVHVCDIRISDKLGAGEAGEQGLNVTFFGDAMQHGLRGYVLTNKADDSDEEQEEHQTVVLFATDPELENGVPDVQTYRVAGDWPTIAGIKMLSDDSLLLLLSPKKPPPPPPPRGNEPAGQSRHMAIAHIPSVPALRAHLSPSASAAALPNFLHTTNTTSTLQSDAPKMSNHVSTNATTTTLVDANMRVWTWSNDARYQRCLGRPYDGESALGQVTFLSETLVTKVVSGGYVSAALSSEGELFVWGQACPGSKGEISVLGGRAEGDGPATTTTGITVEGEQDEHVKCLVVYIDGVEASVYDVAVGYGHVLVAAEAGAGPADARTVFAAGDNARGQLGVTKKSFQSEFIEVVALRGKRIAQLSAAGWSSFVVTLEE